MGKVTQVQNGDSGLKARTSWNEALQSVAVSEIDDGTAGELITWDAAGNTTTVSAGTSDYILTSNGTGAEPTFQDPANNTLLIALIESMAVGDYYAKVANDEISGRSIMKGFGERKSWGTTATGEDVWRGNELTPAPTSTIQIPTPAPAGEQMTVVSESTADNGATATGVLTLRIKYLDAAGDQQTEDITLNGTTPVNTVATDIRFVNDMYSLTVGSGGVAAGHIKIYKTGTAGLVYNMIALGGNKSMVPHRMVPADHTLILKSWYCSEGNTKRISFRIRSTDMDGVLIPDVFCFKGPEYLNKSASPEMALYDKIPALSIVKVSGWATLANAEGSCYWWGELINNTIT